MVTLRVCRSHRLWELVWNRESGLGELTVRKKLNILATNSSNWKHTQRDAMRQRSHATGSITPMTVGSGPTTLLTRDKRQGLA